MLINRKSGNRVKDLYELDSILGQTRREQPNQRGSVGLMKTLRKSMSCYLSGGRTRCAPPEPHTHASFASRRPPRHAGGARSCLPGFATACGEQLARCGRHTSHCQGCVISVRVPTTAFGLEGRLPLCAQHARLADGRDMPASTLHWRVARGQLPGRRALVPAAHRRGEVTSPSPLFR